MTTRAPEQDPAESGHGVRIARIAGVPVYLAPSWFLIAAVIIAIVARPYLPDRVGTGILIGVTQALLLLFSVLVHETAHAMTALLFRMPVIRIVANLWGGHTSFEAIRSTPGRIAAISAAGPASNAVLALVAWLLLLGTTGDRTSAVLTGLVIINASLAVLNVLPGMPLDGGQIVESLVWKATGDRNKGSIVAGWGGRVLTALLVLWFFVRPLVERRQIGFDAVWVLVIGSVLWSGATASIRRGRALSSVSRLRVGDVAEAVVVLPPQTSLGDAAAHPDLVLTTDERGAPVLLLLEGAAHSGLDPATPLISVVTRLPDECLVPAEPGDSLDLVLATMGRLGVGLVVLTRNGHPWALTSGDRIEAAFSRN